MKLDDGIDKEELDSVTGPAKSYARFGAMGIQMVAFLIIGVLGGRWIDGKVVLKFPLFTVLGVVLGLTGALWFLFKEVSKK
ncbi:MAG TPA: AtpZ/AtpI family protein [Flavobacteriales bacterium]|nr:AtpZ/AtpI family protein [Flavobacteriales bacterium]